MTNNRKTKKRKPYLPMLGCLGVIVVGVVLAIAFAVAIPYLAISKFGQPAQSLDPIHSMQYSALVVLHSDEILQPSELKTNGIHFKIQPGESPISVADSLKSIGLIRSSSAFLAYLSYTGHDIALQQGDFLLDGGLNIIEITSQLLDPIPTQGKLVVLPGWRLEEIAASIPTSGLEMTPADFLSEAYHSSREYAYIPLGGSVEGYLLPGEYTFERDITPAEMIAVMVSNFEQGLTSEYIAGFANQGLGVQQAVILASIIQREAVIEEEQPMMASVFLNRLNQGMRLESDPTVQYSVGVENDWWKVPLTASDLGTDSAYNTYVYAGLPPSAISNPDLSALASVAAPAVSDFLYFQAKCDGSGYHNFALTYEEHLANSCR